MSEPDSYYRTALQRLLAYCQSQEWSGYDPYDGLNSNLFHAWPLKSWWTRLAFAQIVKRSPINLRPILGTKKSLNPKGLSLFLNGCVILHRLTGERRYLLLCQRFLDLLKGLSCTGYSGYCWGYNFDWQSRFFFLPQGTPTAVNTAFVADALLNLYEILGQEEVLQMARSSCDFFLQDLHRWEQKDELCFSYTPLDHLQVYNANILVAHILSRIHRLCGDKPLLDLAQKATSFVVRHQNKDGSWFYGTEGTQHWVDGHHTGFILVALDNIMTSMGRTDLLAQLEAGLDFYRRHLFHQDGVPKYYHNSLYPIDIHCATQGVITFTRLRARSKNSLAFAQKIARWSIQNLQDPEGYFYYRKGRFLTNKIPYMRWGQAWMFYALSELLSALNEGKEKT